MIEFTEALQDVPCPKCEAEDVRVILCPYVDGDRYGAKCGSCGCEMLVTAAVTFEDPVTDQ